MTVWIQNIHSDTLNLILISDSYHYNIKSSKDYSRGHAQRVLTNVANRQISFVTLYLELSLDTLKTVSNNSILMFETRVNRNCKLNTI